MTTQAQEFDLHASIKWLAEAERECPDCDGTGKERSLRQDREYNKEPCQTCYNGQGITGIGRIVPFASLRVPCLQSNHHSYLDLPGGCPSCLNRAWIPEPDVERACWRVFKLLPGSMLSDTQLRLTPDATTWEEAVLRGAEAWLKETHGAV